MVLFNHATREMTAKIVYYGPGLCGKTTNLMVIFDKLDPKQKGKMLSLATKTDRTLFFDLLPVDIGKVGNFNLKIQLYTVPGQVFYNETRKLVLKGADSVVFVADSQASMVDSNKESFENLLENLRENQIDPDDTPIIIQFNKRDIPGVPAVEQLQEMIGLEGYPFCEASALRGDGVMETFKLASKITAKHLMSRLKGRPEKPERVEAAPKPKVVAKPAPAPEPAPAAESPAEDAPLSFSSSAPTAAGPEINPFGDSLPFPSAAEQQEQYDKVEEVSLEQLLMEGRERPATLSGTIRVPLDLTPAEEVEEVEELGTDQLVAVEEAPHPVAVDEPQASGPDPRVFELEEEVLRLRNELSSTRERHRTALLELATEIEAIAAKVRSLAD